jgi:hypothetical protein
MAMLWPLVSKVPAPATRNGLLVLAQTPVALIVPPASTISLPLLPRLSIDDASSVPALTIVLPE